jgi:uracil phosphoribosyltransferase
VLQLVTHPLVHDCPRRTADSRTSPERFRALANRISVLLGAEGIT